ncbi:FecR family protein [Pedobacter ginsengisoli]|uniref:FecR family protein n=1 Tax=Pedobacter ginsengisoli TaxID=363852 RepID=UPI0025517901|nr:FecR family protein [Pedobacter ginsengisoli]
MTNEEFISLAEKVAEGSASLSEIALYHASYESFQQDPQSLTADGLDSRELKKESLARFWKNNSHSKPTVKLWPKIAVAASRSKFGTSLIAAAVVGAIVIGVYFFNANRHANTPPRNEFGAGSQDIAPGKNGATITLGNGKVIALSDAKSGVVVGNGKIFYSSLRASEAAKQPHDEIASIPRNDGVGENSMILTASTAKGQTYQFTLPDGTKVWLNADSKISFPSQFSGKERKILLNGEGYFEVAKDKAHPFMVETDQQIVEVLGTHFNINAYHNEKSVRTTLLEGSVRVALITSSLRGTKQPSNEIASEAAQPRNDGIKANAIVLKPNQQSTLVDGGVIRIEQVDVENIIAWQKGYFMFNNETLENIMKRVARWYDVEVIYENDQTKRVTYYGTVSRFENISKVLSKLQATSNVKFKIESKKIYISE